MKSKQLNFFITPEDFENINEFLIINKCLILADKYIQNNLIYTLALPNQNDNIFKIYLTKTEFLNAVTTHETDKGVLYYNNIESSIIEFSLGGFYPYNKKILHRGRFYYTEGYFENSEFKFKSDDFINWANSLIDKFKKAFLKKYSKDDSALYSNPAINYIEKNKMKLTNGGQQWMP